MAKLSKSDVLASISAFSTSIVRAKKVVLLTLVPCLAMQGALANGYLTPSGQGVTIEKIHVHGPGGITLWVSGISNPDGCGGTSLVHIQASLAGYKEMAAAVMTAYAMDRKVGLWATGCGILPFWGGTTTYPLVHTLWVTD